MLRNKKNPEAPQQVQLGKRKKVLDRGQSAGQTDRASRQTEVVQETEKEPWRGRKRTGHRCHRSQERKGFQEAVHYGGCPGVQQGGEGSAGT